MNPFIFQFRETGNAEPLDYSTVQYDDSLNLSIDRFSGRPAVEFFNLGTETFTKTSGEGSDSDKNSTRISLETQTMTFVNTEGSDSDKNLYTMRALLDTTTATRSIENSDQD